jgi:hypothetical protein
MMATSLCTVLSGGQDCTDMAEFARVKLPFPCGSMKLEHGAPSHDTFSRLIRLLDAEQFHGCFQRFMARFAETCQGVVAIDGKVLRRSFDKASGTASGVRLGLPEQQLLLGQVATDAKSNEITAVPKLLKMLSFEGCRISPSCAHGAQLGAQGSDAGPRTRRAHAGPPRAIDHATRSGSRMNPASQVSPCWVVLAGSWRSPT